MTDIPINGTAVPVVVYVAVVDPNAERCNADGNARSK